MRTELQAWQLLLKKFVTANKETNVPGFCFDFTGLCAAIDSLYFDDGNKISEEVHAAMMLRLYRHRPKGKDVDCYWWDTGKLAPRIAFIRRMIKEIKNNP